MDRESFLGAESLRQNHLSEAYSWPACGYLSVYASQNGQSDEVKDLFFDQLRAVTARIPGSEFLVPCGEHHPPGSKPCIADTWNYQAHDELLWDPLPFLLESIFKLSDICLLNRPSSNSPSQLIPRMFNGV